jgi:hypothetical protein
MVRDDTVRPKRFCQEQFADVDVDSDKDAADFAIEVDLRVGRGVGAAGEAVGQDHDLGQPHSGIIAIGGR